jgi:NADH-quinone oxidoreductase subunit M
MEIELAEHLVVLVVALPALVGLGLVATSVVLGLFDLPDLPEAVWLAVGLAAGFVTFALMLFGIVIGFDPEQLGLQFAASFVWSDTFGAKLLLGIDGIGLCFMLSTAGLVPLAMLSSRGEERESNRAWVLVCLALETTLLGALASANLISFIFFWSASLLPTMLWVGRWGGPGRARAASRIWTMESLGLAGLLFVAFVLHRTTLEQFGVSNLDLTLLGGEVGRTLLDVRIEESDQWVLFVVMTLSLAIRLPVVPFHFWLPAAQAAAPTGLSVLLATGFVQTAAIGLLRFALPLFPDAAMAAGPTLSVLGIVAFVYASLIALAQRELKRLVAYASVGYAGFAVFGISTFNVQGLTGAVLQLLTHGLATAALFMLIGFLAIRRGTTEVKAFGGLAKPMPVCAFFFGLMVLSLMGLPLLGGFVGDLFVLLGSLETRRELSVIALISIVVAASYLLWVQRRLFLGPVVEPSNRGLIDLDRVERGILLAMAIPIVAIGVYPNPVLRRVEPAVLEILYQMERRSVSVEVEEVDSELVQGGAAETGKSSDR